MDRETLEKFYKAYQKAIDLKRKAYVRASKALEAMGKASDIEKEKRKVYFEARFEWKLAAKDLEKKQKQNESNKMFRELIECHMPLMENTTNEPPKD